MKTASVVATTVGLGAMVALAVVGNYHFIHGSTYGGPPVMPKLSWSLSETLINFDAVGNMPMIMARGNYPMFIAAWERRSEQDKALIEAARKIANESDDAQLKQGSAKLAMSMTREQVLSIMPPPETRVGPFASDAGPMVETFYWPGVVVYLSAGVVTKIERN